MSGAEKCLGRLNKVVVNGEQHPCATPPPNNNCLGYLNQTKSACEIATPTPQNPCIGDVDKPIVICLDATYKVYSEGELIEIGSIKSGGSKDIVVDSILCQPVTYLVRYFNGTIIEQGSENSGGSILVEVDNPIVCNPVSWQLIDEDENVLESGTEDCGEELTITAPDSTLTVNSAAFTTARSGQTKDIGLIDERNANITPISLTGGNIKVYTGGDTRSIKSGDTADGNRGRLNDFLTLSENNPFGHTRRFTGRTGGYHNGTNWVDVNGSTTTEALAFPNNIVLDWAQRTATQVRCYSKIVEVGSSAGIKAASPYTIGGISGFRGQNDQEKQMIMVGNVPFSSSFNYPPFNHVINSGMASVMSFTSNGAGAYPIVLSTNDIRHVTWNGNRSIFLVNLVNLSTFGL